MKITHRLINKAHKWTSKWLEKKKEQPADSQGADGWDNAILLYQPGKVASTTFHASLLPVWKGPIVHLHSFRYDQKYPPLKTRLVELYDSKQLPKVNIITSIREPIGRNLSAFFQNLNKFNAISFDGVPFTTEELLGLTIRSHKVTRILNWFDDELKEHFGIDVYEKNLNSEGFQLYENHKARVLLMKHDLPDLTKADLIGKFLNVSDFKLKTQKNRGESKWYGDEYQKFKKRGFPEWYVSQMLESKYAKHFYGAEIPALKEKWTEKEII